MDNNIPPRFIPVLFLHDDELYKTRQFKPDLYVGEPLNAVRVFNLKAVDELLVCDIDATQSGRINFKLIEKMAAQCFTPLSYGGGVASFEQVDQLFQIGVDKIVLSSSAIEKPDLITQISAKYGQQAVIVSVDLKVQGQLSYRGNRQKYQKETPLEFAQRMVRLGAGEILLKNVAQDGTYLGMDHEAITLFANALDVPLIACSGAKNWDDLEQAVKNGASAVASGSQFTFYGPHQAVLQTYPDHWNDRS
ncbi:putative imidazole glycerol phosphate synthase subunit hisF2 [Candidatus Terasakiella magnetica]|uniref:Imidazole glycerol phosphate synthase subunit HisF n=1 Tax=Candidatus Terasakiella magnetica TaxID=1867952 RepID=A0A1C3RG46_9PROT|nr:HisA/HisF-related TIM barrel protein [Candidatus Terasakiella magnetica]SCA56221.1 putative imidazole glycerol phosphate synthase subunit hisF2 [Candidatus Terasakiella magnetica]